MHHTGGTGYWVAFISASTETATQLSRCFSTGREITTVIVIPCPRRAHRIHDAFTSYSGVMLMHFVVASTFARKDMRKDMITEQLQLEVPHALAMCKKLLR